MKNNDVIDKMKQYLGLIKAIKQLHDSLENLSHAMYKTDESGNFVISPYHDVRPRLDVRNPYSILRELLIDHSLCRPEAKPYIDPVIEAVDLVESFKDDDVRFSLCRVMYCLYEGRNGYNDEDWYNGKTLRWSDGDGPYMFVCELDELVEEINGRIFGETDDYCDIIQIVIDVYEAAIAAAKEE